MHLVGDGDDGSSPHTRGALARGGLGRPASRIIPAYAGSTRDAPYAYRKPPDHPRIRGEHMPWGDSGGQHPGSSPHTRGAPIVGGEVVLGLGIIPAYAGSTDRAVQSRHPAGGSSPHTRGAPFSTSPIGPASGIIPAYAGSTTLHLAFRVDRADHPRIRGEHMPIPMVVMCGIRIIPAYAGSTIRPPSRSRRPRDHPRIRGEHADVRAGFAGAAGSSPHTRGAPRPLPPWLVGSRIIPAYAGSTSTRAPPIASPRDHPRIRGEHYSHECELPDSHGSSPHTRGARDNFFGYRLAPGIIPAYAGSTRI